MDFRFAVGKPDGPQANGWNLWGQGEKAYLLQRAMGKVQKFSFPQDRNLPLGPDRGKGRRPTAHDSDGGATQSQKRAPARLVVLCLLPFLPITCRLEGKAWTSIWIEPALTGHAAMVEISLTREDRATIQDFFQKRGERKLVFCQTLRNGTNLCAAVLRFDCGPVNLRIPAEPVRPEQVFGNLLFRIMTPRAAGGLSGCTWRQVTLPPLSYGNLAVMS